MNEPRIGQLEGIGFVDANMATATCSYAPCCCDEREMSERQRQAEWWFKFKATREQREDTVATGYEKHVPTDAGRKDIKRQMREE